MGQRARLVDRTEQAETEDEDDDENLAGNSNSERTVQFYDDGESVEDCEEPPPVYEGK